MRSLVRAIQAVLPAFYPLLMALYSVVVPTSASATIIAVLQSGPILITGGPLAGDFAFNYIVKLSGDERLDPAATNGATCPGPGGPVQCNPAGTFVTIYDTPGIPIFGITAPLNWSSATSPLGTTPSSINGTFDNPGIENVTFNYTGPVVHANGTDLQIAGFQIISEFGGLNLNGNFSSQTTKDTGDASGLTDQVVGFVPVPAAPVPEPASLLLACGGLAGLAVGRARRKGV